MIDQDEAEQLVNEGWPVETSNGDRLGPVCRVFLDDYTGWPRFVTITLDPDSDRETFVALHEADLRHDRLVVPYPLPLINSAPTVTAAGSLSTHEEDDLFDYYGVPIDGVSPSVSHLGDELVPANDGDVEKAEPPT